MIYDNKKCCDEAASLIRKYGHDLAALEKAISGELNRYYMIGKFSVIHPMERLIEVAKKTQP